MTGLAGSGFVWARQRFAVGSPLSNFRDPEGWREPRRYDDAYESNSICNRLFRPAVPPNCTDP